MEFLLMGVCLAINNLIVRTFWKFTPGTMDNINHWKNLQIIGEISREIREEEEGKYEFQPPTIIKNICEYTGIL